MGLHTKLYKRFQCCFSLHGLHINVVQTSVEASIFRHEYCTASRFNPYLNTTLFWPVRCIIPWNEKVIGS